MHLIFVSKNFLRPQSHLPKFCIILLLYFDNTTWWRLLCNCGVHNSLGGGANYTDPEFVKLLNFKAKFCTVDFLKDRLFAIQPKFANFWSRGTWYAGKPREDTLSLSSSLNAVTSLSVCASSELLQRNNWIMWRVDWTFFQVQLQNHPFPDWNVR